MSNKIKIVTTLLPSILINFVFFDTIRQTQAFVIPTFVIIERVTESVTVAESPHWDFHTETLYYVDAAGRHLVRFTPSTKKFAKVSTGSEEPSFFISIEGEENHFVISLSNSVNIIEWDGESDNFTIIHTISKFGAVSGIPVILGDGKCDSSGRLWTGTLAEDSESLWDYPPIGTLYSIDANRKIKSHTKQVKITNGMCWNDALRKMFYVDSLKGILSYDYDYESGSLSNEQLFFTLENHDIPGIPDGITIDTDGNLWIAIFLGGRVIKIDGRNPETLLWTIKMPAPEVTSVTWGGRNFDELFVTTAALEMEGVIPNPPVDGAVYKITGTGCRGFPAVKYQLSEKYS